MLYGYKILPDEGIIIQFIDGKINLSDMKTFITSIRKDKDYKPKYNSLIDVRRSYMNLDEKDMVSYIKHLKLMKGFLKERKLALIISKPEHFVHVELMKELGRDLPLKVQVFTTFNMAVNWLEKPNFKQETFENTVLEIITDIT